MGLDCFRPFEAVSDHHGTDQTIYPRSGNPSAGCRQPADGDRALAGGYPRVVIDYIHRE